MNTQLNRVLAETRVVDLRRVAAREGGSRTEPSRTRAVEVAPARTVEAFSALPSDTLVLADGAELQIRPLNFQDRDGLAALFARLSPESRYRRFLSPKPALRPRELAYLTDTDDFHHVALAAVDTRDGSIVGVGRYVRCSDRPSVADVAFEVADGFQSMGIGSALAAHIVQRAHADGVAVLTATTLRENAPARALSTGFGFRTRASQDGVVELQLELTSKRPRAQRCAAGRSGSGQPERARHGLVTSAGRAGTPFTFSPAETLGNDALNVSQLASATHPREHKLKADEHDFSAAQHGRRTR